MLSLSTFFPNMEDSQAESRSLHKESAMWSKHTFPLELWLGRESLLNPYLDHRSPLKVKKMKPKELKVIADEFFKKPGMKDFLEWSSLRMWVKDWLPWYSPIFMSPDPDIEEFFKASLVNDRKVRGFYFDSNLIAFLLALYGRFMTWWPLRVLIRRYQFLNLTPSLSKDFTRWILRYRLLGSGPGL